MSWDEFTHLKKGQSVEDKDGKLGNVTGVEIDSETIWVLWEDEKEPLWSNYWDVKVY